MRILMLFLVAVSMSSCSYEFYCKRCPATTTHTIEIKDTVIIKEILKDTTVTVYLPADSVITILWVQCDSLGMAQMKEHIIKANNMIVRLSVQNGKLTQNITHLLDSLQVTIQYKEIEITKLHSTIDKLKETKVVKEKYIPKFVKWLAYGGLLFLIYIVFRLLTRKFAFRIG